MFRANFHRLRDAASDHHHTTIHSHTTTSALRRGDTKEFAAWRMMRQARAILGGLLAGEPATLFVLPTLYSLMVRGSIAANPEDDHGQLPATPHMAH